LDRLSRLRCLASGELVDSRWYAFVAPTGSSLPDVIVERGKLAWGAVRSLLQELTAELAQANTEGTAPETLSIGQVWPEPNGRMKLLDMPVSMEAAPVIAPDCERRALGLLAEVAILTLEGQPRRVGTESGEIRAPMPRHAAAMVKRLFPGPRQYAGVSEFEEALRATRDRPTEATRTRRMASVAALAACLSPSFVIMFAITLAIQAVGLLFLAEHQTTGTIALGRLRDGESWQLAAALAQRNPLERARIVMQIDADRQLAEQLQQVVERTGQELDARKRWFHPLLRPTGEWTTAIGGESKEDRANHLVQFRQFAAEEANFHNDPDWRELHEWSDLILPAVILGGPALWTVWVFLTRGGLVLWFSGLCLVNARGQGASRLRCAWRALLIWLPIAPLLIAALKLEEWYWSVWQPTNPHVWAPWLFGSLWWAAFALLLSYAVLALWFPIRGPHDRLAGTYVVPR